MRLASGTCIFALFALFALAGCASARPRSEAMPHVEIRPGVPERIALMDAYRLGDDIRKQMMARPRVWVEEVPDTEAAVDETKTETVTESEGGTAPAE